MYTSVSEVVREALCMMETRDAEQLLKLESLHHEIQCGLHYLDAGESQALDIDAIKSKTRAQLEGMRY